MIESGDWIDFISVVYMPADTTESVAEHSAIKAATINQLTCPSYSLYVPLLCYPMYYPGRNDGSGKPYAVIEAI